MHVIQCRIRLQPPSKDNTMILAKLFSFLIGSICHILDTIALKITFIHKIRWLRAVRSVHHSKTSPAIEQLIIAILHPKMSHIYRALTNAQIKAPENAIGIMTLVSLSTLLYCNESTTKNILANQINHKNVMFQLG